MKGLLTSLNPDTKIFIPLSRILYIYEEDVATTNFCHIALEGTDKILTVVDTVENIQKYLRTA